MKKIKKVIEKAHKRYRKRKLMKWYPWWHPGIYQVMQEWAEEAAVWHRKNGHLMRSDKTALELEIFAGFCQRLAEDGADEAVWSEFWKDLKEEKDASGDLYKPYREYIEARRLAFDASFKREQLIHKGYMKGMIKYISKSFNWSD